VAKDHVEQRDGGYWVAGTRISLDSLVYAFLRGASPESIAQSFPVLRLEEVYGAVAYYLAHQAELDAYLRSAEQQFDELRHDARSLNPLLYQKLAERSHSSRS
jgi:uncharacterized protein (DUF433 family)